MTDEYVDAYLKANGIDMTEANRRLRKMVDAAEAGRCPRCEGTGRYRRFGCEEKPCSLCDGTGKSPCE